MCSPPSLRTVDAAVRAVELAPPQDRAHAAQQLRRRERLRHVVVRAELEPEHAVDLRVARRQHQDRHVALGAQLAADVGARHPGQHHVEDDDVVAAASRAASSAAVPSRLLVDVEALAPQHERDDVEHARIVVDDEDARCMRAHARHLLAHARPLEHDPHPRPFAGRRVELDAPAEAAHRLPHDREPEPEALGVAVLAAVEAVEDVLLRLRAHADTGVLDLHTHSCTRPRTRATRSGRCGVCFAAFSPRFRSACSSRSRLTIATSSGGQSTSTATPSIGRSSSATSCSSAPSDDRLDARPLLPGVRARERQQRAREPREPLRLALDVREEAVALDRDRPSRPPAAPRPRR